VVVLAFPLVLSTGSWAVQHFVDRMFLAWHSPEAVAAAMPAGILNFSAMSLFIGAASYVSTFVAQYSGAGMSRRIGPVLWQGVYFSLVGALVMAGLIPVAGPFFTMVGHDPAIKANEIVYFQYLCIGAFPVIASSALSGFFTGLGRPWPVMWVNLCATAVNLMGDYALIFGRWGFPEMGIRGAAIASVLSGFASLALYGVLLGHPSRAKGYGLRSGWRPDSELFGRLLAYGMPSGVQFFLDMAGFTAFILIVGRLGMVSLAATTIAFNINTLAFMPMIGIGIAVSVLVGRHIGRQDPETASRSTYSGFFLTFVYMGVVAFLYVAVPGLFTAPFAAGSEAELFGEIERLTRVLLRFVALYSLFDTMNIVFASAIKGAGDTRFVMYMIVAVSACVLVIPTWVVVSVLHWGIMAAWTSATAYVIVLGFVFFLRFRQGKWKGMRVIEEKPVIHPLPPAASECPDTKFEP